MNKLTIIKQDGGMYLDSRDVAKAIGKDHRHLLRDIRKYREIIAKSIAPKVGRNDFFLESSYVDCIGRTLPCYLLSKMGCEVVANKMNGERGVLFTVAYVAKFNEMEAREQLEQAHFPRLGEFNAAARLIIPAMQDAGATPKHVVAFLRGIYKPLGIAVLSEGLNVNKRTWSASDIAKMLGAYSVSGKPHNLAISAIVGLIGIGNMHKLIAPVRNGVYTGVSIRYDDIAAMRVKAWFEENGYPSKIVCGDRVFRVFYEK